MSGKQPTLEQLQRWMQSVIMHPGGVAQGLSAPEAREHLDVAAEDLETIITRSRALDGAARLEIYVDAYYERLLECLREEFTATRRAVGDELFEALAFGYLQHYPSRSYTLNALGGSFPKYLAESRLHERAAPSGAGPAWPDLIVELAIFERSMREVFDSPGSEGHGGLNLAELAAVGAEHWGQLRFTGAACLRLHRFAHPLHVYWGELKDGGQPVVPEPRPTCLAVNRRHYHVEQYELTATEFALLVRLVDGETLGQAIAGVVELPGVDWLSLEQDVQRWFSGWTARQFFVELRLAHPDAETRQDTPV